MPLAEIAQHAVDNLVAAASTAWGLLSLAAAVLACALVIAGAFVKTILPLRWLAVGSSVGFLAYGALHPAPMLLALHAVLLPVNLYRALEMVRLTRRVERVAAHEDLGVWLRPYMRKKRLKAGSLVFRRGEFASRLYYLAEGQIEFVERGSVLEAGRMFGEIAFFAPDRRRSASARCRTDCTVLSIDEATFRQLYFQNPAFGFEVVRLVAGRLSHDVARLEERLSESGRPGEPPPGELPPGESLLPAAGA